MSTAKVARMAGAILAGGRASRFGGFPKGTLRRPDGCSVVGHLLGVLNAVGVTETVIVANPPHPYGELGCPVIPDAVPGLGPLGGVETALAHYQSSHEAVLFLPCDLPGLGVKEVEVLRRAYEVGGERLVVAETGPDRMEPLCSIVAVGLREEIGRAVREGQRSVHRLWRSLAAHTVRFPDAAPFCNVNAAEDWAAWCKRQAQADVRGTEQR